MTEMRPSMDEAELLEVISGLRPLTLAIESIYEGISVPDFTIDEIANKLGGSRPTYQNAFGICLQGKLFEQTKPEQPRHNLGRAPNYFRATPLAFALAVAHNRLHTRLIHEQLFEQLPIRTIVERALGGHARHMGLQDDTNVGPQELAEKVGLHPSTVVPRALGAFAMSQGAHRRVLVARTRLARQ